MIFAAGDLAPLTGLSAELSPLIANVLLLFVTGLVGLAARGFLRWMKANTTVKQQDVLYEFALQAVRAAEGLGLTNQVDDKKEYAYSLVDKALADAGISLSSAQIESAIEAAVLEEFNRYKQPLLPVTPDEEAASPDNPAP